MKTSVSEEQTEIAATLNVILEKLGAFSAFEPLKLVRELLTEIESNRLDLAISLCAVLKDIRVAAQFEADRPTQIARRYPQTLDSRQFRQQNYMRKRKRLDESRSLRPMMAGDNDNDRPRGFREHL